MDKLFDEKLNVGNLLYFKGSLFNIYNKSYYGYRIDVLKSALQKYLRRKEVDKMIWVMIELYMFKFTNERGNGVLSNMINRVKIFLDEEMCFDDWERYLKIMNLIEEFEKNGRKEIDILIKICKVLVDCNMLRLNSDVKCYYKFCVDKYGYSLCDSIVNKKRIMKYLKKEDSEESVDLFGRFVDLFEKGEEDCCYYAVKLMVNEEERKIKGGIRFRRKGCSYMVWEYLMDKCYNKKNDKLLKVMNYRLKEYYKKRGERVIFMTASIYMLLKCNEIDWEESIDFNKYKMDEEDVKKIIDDREKLVIDSYCIDMHCSEGRKKGMNKKDFVLEGALVVDEYKKYSREEWRKLYIKIGIEKAKKNDKMIKEKKKNDKMIKEKKKNDKMIKEKKKISDKELKRKEKMKRIKKKRGKPNFNELEVNLKKVDEKDIDINKIRLCTETTCGNKVMCFEYEGKIWKEGRKSMFYNRDYCVVDECKEYFGLNKIGMERVLSNFKLGKKDKNKKSWEDNWEKVKIKENEELVVYCIMDKIIPGIEFGKFKKENKKNMSRDILKEYVKIGVYRGIFRVSDFNGRNVLIKKGEDIVKLVSIDEGDIGKRVNILGGREKWLVKELNKDKSIIDEIIRELYGTVYKVKLVVMKMKEYKFSDELCDEVIDNWKNLRNDLKKEGVEC